MSLKRQGKPNGSEGSEADVIDVGTENEETRQDLVELGRRIRNLRMAQQMTLEQLASHTGLSISMISTVERGRANPSIGTLIAISAALSVPMVTLFDDKPATRVSPVVRHEEQPIVTIARGFKRRLLVMDRSRGVEMAHNEYSPGATSSPEPVKHLGFEFGVVLEGTIEVELDGEVHQLREGDTIAYASSSAHRSRNTGSGKARTVWVNLHG